MTKRPRDSLQRKLDLAARAAWLYFIADNTQDEIAGKLNVSRQAAQRLVALAVSEKLIKFRLDHPISECMELGEALRERYEMEFCQVTPSDSGAGDSVSGPAIWAAERLESYLSQKAPMILAVSTGRTLRAAVDQVAVMTQPHHKIADRVGAQCFPIPTPVIASSVEERALLQSQRSFVAVKELAEQAKASFVGMSEIAWEAPLHRDGFVNDGEIAQLIEMGAVGEIAGWAFDGNGTLIADATNERVAGLPLEAPPHRPTIAVAGGRAKANAIRAALRGKLISGLITDESAARAILADD
jgi:DNA-binding transcriptional regulator LsrR (DeoR family)